ncbi:hypothetical protein [Frigoriflavimonas asaccharolytica]|uniref:Lipoprotein n=1 Tax=Frigoriflavimonas asaccharolytica TaxID=2735899 RepID=A0A8J8GDV2_9FLAO|nr:hypothetical protein [Frigoriflavimonas asaccharolytica]NRS94012.1 hypothetical protein [Frigoriflavimonas asaccharolytica]
MKTCVILFLSALTIYSCNSKIKNPETLPKDIIMKKVLNENYASDSSMVKGLQLEIENIIAEKTCSDASKWKISPIGAKPCGGAAYYIAYPKEIEEDILPKINIYTAQESGFNEKYGITSDCLVANEPTGILCENGKAVLQYSSLEESLK